MGDISPVTVLQRVCSPLKKVLSQILGIESGEEVKQLMLGRVPPARNLIDVCFVTNGFVHQNLDDLAENFWVSVQDAHSEDLYLMEL